MVNQGEKDALPDSLITKEFKKNGKLLIFRIYDHLLNIFPALANLSRKGVQKDKILNAFQKMTLEDLKNPQFDIPVIQSQERTKAISIYQSKNFKALPVIDENENPTKSTKTAKFQNSQSKNKEEVQVPQKNKSDDTSVSMTFSKIHTKESELNSSIDLNSSFKTLTILPTFGKTK